MTSVRVGFTAKDNGFHFANRFPSRPIRQFKLGDVGFDTPSGTLAGQKLNGSGRFNLDTTGGPARMATAADSASSMRRPSSTAWFMIRHRLGSGICRYRARSAVSAGSSCSPSPMRQR